MASHFTQSKTQSLSHGLEGPGHLVSLLHLPSPRLAYQKGLPLTSYVIITYPHFQTPLPDFTFLPKPFTVYLVMFFLFFLFFFFAKPAACGSSQARDWTQAAAVTTAPQESSSDCVLICLLHCASELHQDKFFVSQPYPQDPEQWLIVHRSPTRPWWVNNTPISLST